MQNWKEGWNIKVAGFYEHGLLFWSMHKLMMADACHLITANQRMFKSIRRQIKARHWRWRPVYTEQAFSQINKSIPVLYIHIIYSAFFCTFRDKETFRDSGAIERCVMLGLLGKRNEIHQTGCRSEELFYQKTSFSLSFNT